MCGYMQCGLSFTYKWLKNKMWFSLEQAEAIRSWDHSYFKCYFPIASYFDVVSAPKMLGEDTLRVASNSVIVDFNLIESPKSPANHCKIMQI